MLVLSRCASEEIVIDFNGTLAVVTVVEIRKGKIRIGIDAPQTVRVDRKEVRDARLASDKTRKG